MKLSTKGRYALRAMLELANNYYENNNSLIDLKHIAKKQQLPIKYLEHLMSDLKNAGLILSERGFAGGYKLKDDPKNINLFLILNSTENITNLTQCLDQEFSCELKKMCATVEIWSGLRNVIIKYFESLSLKNLYDIEKRKLNNVTVK